jgi:hypothetical protein
MPLIQVECIDDYTHNVSTGLHEHFEKNDQLANFSKISSALLCDALLVVKMFTWTVNGGSWRLPLALVGIFALKALLSALYKMRFPETSLWHYPGFYSLLVEYGPTNDTHFTLQIAVLVALAAEYRALRSKLFYLAVFATVYQSILILVLRGAYMIDVFAAFVFGHFFWIAGQWVSYYIDVKVFGMLF